MVYCPKCGTQLPDGAKFCFKCGSQLPGSTGGAAPAAASAPAPTSSAPTIAPAGAEAMKCPSCGGPIHPAFGEMVITCDYCGSSVTLGGGGWKEISKHTMLPLKVLDPAQAIAAVQASLDVGFLHRHIFEESKVLEQKLSFVPFWIIPTSASTTYQYQAVAQSVGATVGTIAAAELLGSVLGGGRRGGFVPVPIMTGPVDQLEPLRHDRRPVRVSGHRREVDDGLPAEGLLVRAGRADLLRPEGHSRRRPDPERRPGRGRREPFGARLRLPAPVRSGP